MTLPLQSGNPVIISSFPRLTTAIPWLSGNQDFTNYAAGLDANKIQLLKALAVKFRGTRAERFVTAVLNETVRLDAIEAFAACQRKMNLRPPVIIAIEDQEAWRQFNYANQLFDTQAIDALAVVIESFPGTPAAHAAASEIQRLASKFEARKLKRAMDDERAQKTREFFNAYYESRSKCCVVP